MRNATALASKETRVWFSSPTAYAVVALRGGTVAAEGTPRDVARSAGAANLQEAFLALARGGEERSVA